MYLKKKKSKTYIEPHTCTSVIIYMLLNFKTMELFFHFVSYRIPVRAGLLSCPLFFVVVLLYLTGKNEALMG